MLLSLSPGSFTRICTFPSAHPQPAPGVGWSLLALVLVLVLALVLPSPAHPRDQPPSPSSSSSLAAAAPCFAGAHQVREPREGNTPLPRGSGLSPQSCGAHLHPRLWGDTGVWLALLLLPSHCMQSTEQCRAAGPRRQPSHRGKLATGFSFTAPDAAEHH